MSRHAPRSPFPHARIARTRVANDEDDAPAGIESNGINTIHERERGGAPRKVFVPWFASNIGIFGISYGAFALAFGLSLWQGIAAGVHESRATSTPSAAALGAPLEIPAKVRSERA
jgi:hypothetical protein